MSERPDAPVQEDEVPIQGSRRHRLPSARIPWAVHEAAADAYNTMYSQSAQRLAERGGFGWGELAAYLLAVIDSDDLYKESQQARERIQAAKRRVGKPASRRIVP